MHAFQATPLVLLFTAITAASAPRFAAVNVKEIYSKLPSTPLLQEKVKQEREAIMKGESAEELRKLLSDLQSIQAKLADKTVRQDENKYRDLARTYELKRQEAQAAQAQFETKKEATQKEINRKMVAQMQKSLKRILLISAEIAEQRGFDSVIDSSGNSNTGVPFVLVIKDAPDLSAEVLATLKFLEIPLISEPKVAEAPAIDGAP
jgi:Skp family chaperone for outer membrane proteins